MISTFIKKLLKPIKKIEWVYAQYYRFTLGKELKLAKAEMRLYEVKNESQVTNELNAIKSYWKCTYTDFYVFYGLFKKQLDIEHLLDYVPPYYFLNYHQEIKHKGIDVHRYKNKLNQYYFFKEKGIITTDLIGICIDRQLKSNNGEDLSISSLINKYLLNEKSKIFFKPVMGEGGAGICVLKCIDSQFTWNNEKVDMANILSKLNPSKTYIIEDGIQQRADLNMINSSCVNTLRVVVQETGGKMNLSVCVLRMGRFESDVDNSAQGGLSIQVNCHTGEFSEFATAEHGGGMYYTHPDSGFEFKNKMIDDWSAIRRGILQNAQPLVEFVDIALDVAITNIGIEIIEMNFGYGIDHLQSTCGGMRRELFVKTPDA